MASNRQQKEQRAQLNAYAKWNPDNCAEKVASLEALQRTVDEGINLLIGRAVIAKISLMRRGDVAFRKVVSQIKMGRAIIDMDLGYIEPGVIIGDGSFVGSEKFGGTNIKKDTTIDNSTIMECAVSGTKISDSTLSHTIAKSSTISACDITYSLISDAELDNIHGSSGGQLITGIHRDAEIGTIGTAVFKNPI